MSAPPAVEPAELTKREVLVNIVRALAILLVLVVLIGVLFRAPMEAAAGVFVAKFGLWGVFCAALMLDALPGLGSQPIVLLACAGGLPGGWVWLAAGVGSWMSGSLGWGVGRALGRWPWFAAWIRRTGLERGLLKHRRRAIFLASLIPFPYGLVTMAAGAAGLPLGEVALGATGRFIKIGLNVAIVVAGWSATRR